MEPFARIVLGRGAPAELPNLLKAIGVELLPERDRHLMDFLISFDASKASVQAKHPVVRIVTDEGSGKSAAADFTSASPFAAASFIVSRALRLPAPFLTADEEIFGRLRTALTLARGPGRVVIEGETGTGKQAMMRLVLAAANDRVERIDCASCDDAGANGEFASAIKALAANGESISGGAAQGGILFLTRVDELSLPAQRRLLNEIHAAPMIRPRIRYLATAARSLSEMTRRGCFAAELHNLFEVALPIAPLRERPADIAMLASYFLSKANPTIVFDSAALKTLCDYPFPGNVRELRNLITRLAILPLASDGIIGRSDILGQIAAAGAGRWRTRPLIAGRAEPRSVPIAPASPINMASGSTPPRRSKPAIRPVAVAIRRLPKPPDVPHSS